MIRDFGSINDFIRSWGQNKVSNAHRQFLDAALQNDATQYSLMAASILFPAARIGSLTGTVLFGSAKSIALCTGEIVFIQAPFLNAGISNAIGIEVGNVTPKAIIVDKLVGGNSGAVVDVLSLGATGLNGDNTAVFSMIEQTHKSIHKLK
jgi:hypothetical protein